MTYRFSPATRRFSRTRRLLCSSVHLPPYSSLFFTHCSNCRLPLDCHCFQTACEHITWHCGRNAWLCFSVGRFRAYQLEQNWHDWWVLKGKRALQQRFFFSRFLVYIATAQWHRLSRPLPTGESVRTTEKVSSYCRRASVAVFVLCGCVRQCILDSLRWLRLYVYRIVLLEKSTNIPVLHLDDLPIYIVAPVSIGIALTVALIVKFLIAPWLHKRVLKGEDEDSNIAILISDLHAVPSLPNPILSADKEIAAIEEEERQRLGLCSFAFSSRRFSWLKCNIQVPGAMTTTLV